MYGTNSLRVLSQFMQISPKKRINSVKIFLDEKISPLCYKESVHHHHDSTKYIHINYTGKKDIIVIKKFHDNLCYDDTSDSLSQLDSCLYTHEYLLAILNII